MSERNNDPELQAMQQVIKALESLENDARTRVLTYVFQRLGLSLAASKPNPLPLETQPPVPVASPAAPVPGETTVADIRSLKEAKQPKSDNQMAALVAYYLKEVAPVNDRKDAISQEDIEKYFKQAGFPLPNRPAMTLVNCKHAGYFDSAGVGLYRLNPVGHNLVAHGMPSSTADGNRRVKKPKSKKATK
ncbi:MAG TPA: hypothetical protein VJT54_08375 [Verrucomicrobiae bacterium]|nr:hypothetical protein [Verrucomicrobiae bacterium]